MEIVAKSNSMSLKWSGQYEVRYEFKDTMMLKKRKSLDNVASLILQLKHTCTKQQGSDTNEHDNKEGISVFSYLRTIFLHRSVHLVMS